MFYILYSIFHEEAEEVFFYEYNFFSLDSLINLEQKILTLGNSVADPEPDPYPYLFGPPGSGSNSTRSGSGSFYHQAKIVRKTFIPAVLFLLYNLLSLKNNVNVASKSNKQKNLDKKGIFSCHLEGH